MEPHAGQEPAPSVLEVDPSDAGLRADVFLFRELPNVSRTRVKQKVQMGEALLNGHRFSTATRLRARDEVRILWRSEPRGESTAEPTAESAAAQLVVLYEDDHLVAVDKPAGTASHPVGGRQAGTVIQAARARYRERIRRALDRGATSFYPTLVHRLDVSTSGVLLIALTREIQLKMQAMSAAHLIEKEYVALVEGRLEESEGLIELPIGPSTESSIALKMACRPDGKPSRTRYEVIERFAAHTLLRAFPVTGRQHQVRVHLAARGHPVVGDLLYKDESLFLSGSTGRHCLHARRAAFPHPVTGQPVSIEAGIPEDFLAILRRVTGDPAGP